MRFSKKRKFTERMALVHVQVKETSKAKLEKIAGPASLGETVETLIEREYDRRVRKLTQQVQEKAC